MGQSVCTAGTATTRADRARPERGDVATGARHEHGIVVLRAPLSLHHGGELRDARIAYSLVGPAGAPVVCALGGISADRYVARRPDGTAGWWGALFGDGRAVDTSRYRVLAFDFLGGNGESSGPEALVAGAASRDVSTFDQALALAHLLDHLGVARLHGFVGASYGGMVALAFAARFPERLDRLVVISAAHEPAPLATAWRTIQRRIVALGAETGREREGLALARALAMTTYRTGEEFARRFRREDGARGAAADGGAGPCDADAAPVWAYLAARGADYVRRMRPAAFVTLSRSIDLHAVAPERLRTPLTLVAVDGDQCVPPALAQALAARAAAPVRLLGVSSLYGHDAFLKENAYFQSLLKGIFA